MEQQISFEVLFTSFALLILTVSGILYALKRKFNVELKKVDESLGANFAEKLERERLKRLALEEKRVQNEILQNKTDIAFIKRLVLNFSDIMRDLMRHLPEGIVLESNLLAQKHSIPTTSYMKHVLDELMLEAQKDGANAISIQAKELKNSYRLSYKDTRNEDLTNLTDAFKTLSSYDPNIVVENKVPTGKYNFQLEFIFNKKKEPLKIGKIYTPEEIDENYGTEIVDSASMDVNEFKAYLEECGSYMHFHLENNNLTLAKDENKRRIALNKESVFLKQVVTRYASISMINQLISLGYGTQVTVQNRRNNLGKITLVIKYGNTYLQKTLWCPTLCPWVLDELYNNSN